VLKSEKAHVAEQISMGVTAIIPIGLVVGVLTGTEVEKVKIAIGEYNKKIDKKIVEIKQKCNIDKGAHVLVFKGWFAFNHLVTHKRRMK
jgi:hypothetical protein